MNNNINKLKLEIAELQRNNLRLDYVYRVKNMMCMCTDMASLEDLMRTACYDYNAQIINRDSLTNLLDSYKIMRNSISVLQEIKDMQAKLDAME